MPIVFLINYLLINYIVFCPQKKQTLSCPLFGVQFINRATYYRWKEKDKRFEKKADEAKKIGRENLSDIAECGLLKNIKTGNQRAIEYALAHNSSRYEPKVREVIIKHSGSAEELRRRLNKQDMDLVNQTTEEIRKMGEELRKGEYNKIEFVSFEDPGNQESAKT